MILITIQPIFSQEKASDKSLDSVVAQLGIDKDNIANHLTATAQSPINSSENIYFLPVKNYKDTVVSQFGYLGGLDVYLVIADSKTNQITTQKSYPNSLAIDAAGPTKIKIDSTLYTLNPETSAFGVMVNYNPNSKALPAYWTHFSLYTYKNKGIKRILMDFLLNHSAGIWDTNCNGEFKETISSISFDRESNKGFRNIIIKDSITYTFQECDQEDKETSEVKWRKLIYNGDSYLEEDSKRE